MIQSHSISLTAARQNLFELVDSVATTGRPVTLTEHGQPKAVVISVSDFEAWLETRPTTPLRSRRKQINGRGVLQYAPTPKTSRYERLMYSLEQAGFILSERPTKGYTTGTPRVTRPNVHRGGRGR